MGRRSGKLTQTHAQELDGYEGERSPHASGGRPGLKEWPSSPLVTAVLAVLTAVTPWLLASETVFSELSDLESR